MKNILRPLGAALAGITAALLVSSCYYDPYYSSTSISGSYSDDGYGQGYGYGGSRFSTSFFVSTGNPGWGYDPYCQSYYDYNRRAYYDPYLYGYYPVGYRPPVMVGCPHPYGYRAGRYCPPPRVIRYNNVHNYHNREQAYRSSNFDWARQVRTKPVMNHREETRPSNRQGYQGSNQSRATDSKYQNRSSTSRSPQTSSRQQQAAPPRSSSKYVNQRTEQARNPQRHIESRPAQRQTQNRPQTRGDNQSHKPQASPPRHSRTEESKKGNKNRKDEADKIRGLGQSRG